MLPLCTVIHETIILLTWEKDLHGELTEGFFKLLRRSEEDNFTRLDAMADENYAAHCYFQPPLADVHELRRCSLISVAKEDNNFG